MNDSFASDYLRLSHENDLEELRISLRDRRVRGKNAIRAAAALRLGELRDLASAPALRDLLTDELEVVRAFAAKALGEVGDSSSESELISLLRDPSALARSGAVEALGRIGSDAAVVPLRRCITDPDPDVRLVAAHALVRLHDPNARELVEKTREQETLFRWRRRWLWKAVDRDLETHGDSGDGSR